MIYLKVIFIFLLIVPTFIGFLREVESPSDVMEYVTDYLGDGKEIQNFVKQFLEKRSLGSYINSENVGTAKKSKNKKSTNEENSSLNNKKKEGSFLNEKTPVNKTNSGEFVEVKVSRRISTIIVFLILSHKNRSAMMNIF